jgi:hypothetical protein
MRIIYYIAVVAILSIGNSFADCIFTNWNNAFLRKYQSQPQEISIVNICDSLHIDTPICGKAIKKWPFSKNQLVTIVENDKNINILLLDSLKRRWNLIASGVVSKEDGYCFDNFDLAKYKISDSVVCIGIQVSLRKALAGGGEIYKKLLLFKIQGNNLVVVFDEQISYSGIIAGDIKKDGTRDQQIINEKAALIASQHLVKGHFVLIKKFNELKMNYLWDGERYKSVDKEIIHKDK